MRVMKQIGALVVWLIAAAIVIWCLYDVTVYVRQHYPIQLKTFIAIGWIHIGWRAWEYLRAS